MVATVRVWIVRALDVAIALYALALLVILLVGGIDLGFLTMRQAAKPILVLWILVPVRVALWTYGWPKRSVENASTAIGARVRTLAQRIPAAVQDAVFAFAVTRIATFAIAFLVNLLYPTRSARPFDLPFERERFAEIFAAWDSGWYFDIATRGYYYAAGGQSSVAFFPLYPMAMRAAAWPFGSSETAVWTAGIVISNLAFLIGLIALHRLVTQIFDDRDVARRTVLYVCVFPFSFFLTRVYPSGLFFLMTVLAVSCAHRSRWGLAGLFGGLATLSRPHGILIAIPLGLMALHAADRRHRLRQVLALAPIPAAFIGYSLYVYSLAGHPLAWLLSQNQWGFSLGHPPWEQLLGLIARVEQYGLYNYFFTSELAPYRLFHGAVALFLVAMVPSVFKRLGVPLGVYVLVSVTIPLTGNSLEGIGRYAAVLFPVFMVLATLRSPRLHEALLIVWSLFLALFAGLFATWHPIY